MDEIHHAILRGDEQAVKRMVDAEPELLHLMDWDARTPLILSVLAGSLPLARYFVEGPAQADVDEAVPPDGCSALFYACRDGRVAIAEYLLSKGANPRQRNRYGTTLPMILATNAPSLPLCHDDDDEEEGEDDTTKLQQEAPHAQVLRLLLRSVAGGPAARAALVDARNQNGKTALVMAIERRRPDLAAALLGAGADPYLMPAGVHHLLPLPLSPGVGTAADRAMAALLEDARQAPQRLALLRRARRVADTAHAVEKVLAGPAQEQEGKQQQQHQVNDEEPPAVLIPKLLAASPPELRSRLESAAAAGGTPGAAFAQTVMAALPHVGLVSDAEDGDGGLRRRRLRATVAFVALDGGLKPELFVELTAMMSHAWFPRVWAAEAEAEAEGAGHH